MTDSSATEDPANAAGSTAGERLWTDDQVMDLLIFLMGKIAQNEQEKFGARAPEKIRAAAENVFRVYRENTP